MTFLKRWRPGPSRDKSALRPGANQTARVETRHLDAELSQLVTDWFAGRITEFETTGDRSVYIPFARDGFSHVKIKGAGYQGRGVRFAHYLKAGPAAPLFDFDGRRMEDVALGHDGALLGGASAQQAVTEWRITQALAALGQEVVPCPGYGSLFNGKGRSWFTVFQWDDRWIDSVKPPHATLAQYRDLSHHIGEIALDLAVNHNLVGYFWCVRDPAGPILLKDLHPFRRLDPVNQSQISWVMQLAHALHITAINTFLLASRWYGEDAARDAGLWLIWPFCPDATREDWDAFRFQVVAEYMLKDPEGFSSETLANLLENNRIGARLMALCPEGFARYRS